MESTEKTRLQGSQQNRKQDLITPLLYFGAADRQLEKFIDQKAFNKNLLLNLFFQGDLLIPDIFFFISSHLESHIPFSEATPSLIGKAIEQGAIIPAFRNSDCQSFRGALEQIRRQRIQGVLPTAEIIADRLDRYPLTAPFYMPMSRMAEGFQERLQSILQAPSPPAEVVRLYDPHTAVNWQKWWDQTARWRHDSINRAIEAVEKALQQGKRDIPLNRGDVMNAVGQSLGYNERVNDLRDILPLAKGNQKKPLEEFWRWLCQIYQLNKRSKSSSGR